MKIKYASGIATGISHIKQEIECQDKIKIVDEGDTVSIALADGAGSRENSGICADIAVNIAASLTSEKFEDLYLADENSIKIEILDKVTQALKDTGLDLKSMASTLLFTVVKGNRYLAGHIGDGLIVKFEGACAVLSNPENGQYRNETYFITDHDAINYFRIYRGEMQEPFGFMLMSDGASQSLYEYSTGKLSSACGTFFEWVRSYDEDTVNEALGDNINKLFTKNTKDDISIGILATEKEDDERNTVGIDSNENLFTEEEKPTAEYVKKFSEEAEPNDQFSEEDFKEEDETETGKNEYSEYIEEEKPLAQNKNFRKVNSHKEAVSELKVPKLNDEELEDVINLTAEGDRYFHGRGLRIDRRRAISYYNAAANKGYAPAQCYLGYIYEMGLGTSKDMKLAKEWYEKARDQGDEYARLKLDETAMKLQDTKKEELATEKNRAERIAQEHQKKTIEKRYLKYVIVCLVLATLVIGAFAIDHLKNKQYSLHELYPSASFAVEDHASYSSGVYQVGRDIPAGEYFFCTGELLEPNSIEVNLQSCLSDYLYCMHIKVNEGDTLWSKYGFTKTEDVNPVAPVKGVLISGKYKIGKDISPGKYQMVPFNNVEGRFYTIANGTISNDIKFSDTVEVTLPEEGYFVIYNSYIIIDMDTYEKEF